MASVSAVSTITVRPGAQQHRDETDPGEPVCQVEVEQHHIGSEAGHHGRQGGGGSVGGGHFETLCSQTQFQPLGDDAVVLDDQHPGHGASSGAEPG